MYKSSKDDRYTKSYQMLEKDNKIWHNINNSIKIGFDGEPVYNKNISKLK